MSWSAWNLKNNGSTPWAHCCHQHGCSGPASPWNKALVAGSEMKIWLLLLGNAIVMTVGGKLCCLCVSQLMELKVTSISDWISETHDFPLSLSLYKKTAEPRPVWHLRVRFETNSPCFTGVAGRGCLALTCKWMYQLSLWATAFFLSDVPTTNSSEVFVRITLGFLYSDCWMKGTH